MMANFFSSPFFLGLLVGFTLHLYNRDAVRIRKDGDEGLLVGEKLQSDILSHVSEEEKKKPEKEKSFVRPRFVKDELNITKRLLVVVITEGENLKYQENLFNLTLQPYVNDIIYFGNNSKKGEKTPKENFPDILDVIKEISSQYLTQYQLFYIIPSSAAIHGKNLKDLTDSLSASDLVYAGLRSPTTGTCDLEAGILLSREVVRQAMSQMDWCARNRVSYDQSLNLAHCVLYASKAKCQESPYKAEKYKESSNSYASSVLFYGARTTQARAHLLQELSLHNQKDLNNKVKHLETEIRAFINSSKYEIVVNWPTGSNTKFRTTDRYDRDVSVSFNQTHKICDNDYEPATRLDTDHTKDVEEILDHCNVQSADFNAGWKKVDATRGTDYILDVTQKSNEKRLVSKKCLAVRELANPEIVPMPFVTESYRISLIVPVMEKDSQKTMSLLRSFAKNSIENSERIFLMLVFIYTPERPDKNNNNDFFKDVKQLALQISKKYKKKEKGKSSSHLLWYSLQTKGVTPSHMELMDLVTHKLDDKTIILLGSPDMEIRTDYFNRVRMNTILGKQVFCPIPFVEYHPAIVYGKKRPSASLSFNTSLGHFDTLNYEHLSLYKSDYVLARSFLPSPVISTEAELSVVASPSTHPTLCELFQPSSVHSLTAPEPSLRLRYEEIFCPQDRLDTRQAMNCMMRRTRSFGRRSQLADMVMSTE
jgi:hypothetical protein